MFTLKEFIDTVRKSWKDFSINVINDRTKQNLRCRSINKPELLEEEYDNYVYSIEILNETEFILHVE